MALEQEVRAVVVGRVCTGQPVLEDEISVLVGLGLEGLRGHAWAGEHLRLACRIEGVVVVAVVRRLGCWRSRPSSSPELPPSGAAPPRACSPAHSRPTSCWRSRRCSDRARRSTMPIRSRRRRLPPRRRRRARSGPQFASSVSSLSLSVGAPARYRRSRLSTLREGSGRVGYGPVRLRCRCCDIPRLAPCWSARAAEPRTGRAHGSATPAAPRSPSRAPSRETAQGRHRPLLRCHRLDRARRADRPGEPARG